MAPAIALACMDIDPEEIVLVTPSYEVLLSHKNYKSCESESDIKAYSNHSANLIEDWKETGEDKIWK